MYTFHRRQASLMFQIVSPPTVIVQLSGGWVKPLAIGAPREAAQLVCRGSNGEVCIRHSSGYVGGGGGGYHGIQCDTGVQSYSGPDMI